MKIMKLLKCFIFLTILSGLFVACAEDKNPVGGKDHYFEGKVITIEGDGIPGIKVTSNYGYTKTDHNGRFVLLSYSLPFSRHWFKFEDVDGEENGLFEEQEINVTIYGDIEVILERKTDVEGE